MSIVGRLSGSLCKLALGTFCLGLVAGVACKPKYAPNEPVDGAPDACCRVANAEMTKFAGCRITHRCKNDEPIWMRGHIKCSPVEEGRCAGGRCCEYRPLYGSPDAVLFWDEEKKYALSAPEILINHQEEDLVKGIGTVRFFFTEEEGKRIEEFF